MRTPTVAQQRGHPLFLFREVARIQYFDCSTYQPNLYYRTIGWFLCCLEIKIMATRDFFFYFFFWWQSEILSTETGKIFKVYTETLVGFKIS